MTNGRQSWAAQWAMTVGLALALGVGLGAAVAEAAPRCDAPRGQTPAVSLDVDPGSVSIDHSRDVDGLQALRRRFRMAEPQAGWSPTGLAHAQLRFSMRVHSAARPLDDGRYCVFLDRVEAEFALSSLTIYVSRRYPVASCQYDAILEHEREHVAVFRDVLEDFAPRLRRAIEEAARRQSAEVSRNPQQTAESFQKRINDRVRPLLAEADRRQADANARLDSPQSYRVHHALCSSW